MDQEERTKGFWEALSDRLKAEGIELGSLCCGPAVAGLKFVCVPSSLMDSVEETGSAPRNQVMMVRVSEETLRTLDDWVSIGAVKSRSEAAAVFIREGLKVREQELCELRDALSDVERAKARLSERARQILGADDGGSES